MQRREASAAAVAGVGRLSRAHVIDAGAGSNAQTEVPAAPPPLTAPPRQPAAQCFTLASLLAALQRGRGSAEAVARRLPVVTKLCQLGQALLRMDELGGFGRVSW